MTFKPSKFYDFTLPANGAYLLTVAGDYWKIMAATGMLSIKADWGELSGLIAGQGLEDSPFQRLYITNQTGAPNTVRIFIGDRRFIDGLQGTVQVQGGKVTVDGGNVNVAGNVGVTGSVSVAGGNVTVGGAVTVAGGNVNVAGNVGVSGNVGITSQVLPVVAIDHQMLSAGTVSKTIFAARPGRKYLLVQNRDAVEPVYLAFGRDAAAWFGLRIPPGGNFELVGVATEQAVCVISEWAPGVIVVGAEG